ncbi:MAG: radical SAM/SPASM domain-containing protein [Syntrophus sp. (in: bacteria)]
MSVFQQPLKGKSALQYIEKKQGYSLEALTAFPKYIMIETINSCNSNCIMCGIDFSKKKKEEMTDSLYSKITREIIDHKDNVEKVMLYLDCEPLLDKKLSQRIHEMKKGGIKRVNIASNASLLTEKVGTEIINAGLDEIYITMDSLKKEVYEQIRCGLNFETVHNNILCFVQLRNKLNPRLVIRIQMVLQGKNIDEVDAFNDHWIPQLSSNDQIIAQKAHNWGSTIKTVSFGDENTINNIPCVGLWGTFCIHVDGEVSLCSMDTKGVVSLGNINSERIADVWSGAEMEKIREKHLSGKRNEIGICDGCALWREDKHAAEEVIRSNEVGRD